MRVKLADRIVADGLFLAVLHKDRPKGEGEEHVVFFHIGAHLVVVGKLARMAQQQVSGGVDKAAVQIGRNAALDLALIDRQAEEQGELISSALQFGEVTVEDILEELVGEIWDEDDVVEEAVVELDDGSYEVDAEESVSDVFEQLGFEDPEENEELVNTRMGEWAYEQFTAIPQAGDSFTYHGLQVTVSEIEHNRILKLRVQILPEETEGGEEA